MIGLRYIKKYEHSQQIIMLGKTSCAPKGWMKMTFLDKMKEEMSTTTTENGALTYTTSLNANLDFFAQAGAMRNRKQDIGELFSLALNEDRKLALYNLVHLRNVRLGGLGERDAFRISFRELIKSDSELAIKLIEFIPHIGRWDDVVDLWWYAKKQSGVDFKRFEESCINFIIDSLNVDIVSHNKDEQVSLLAKWMPSESASNRTVKLQAKNLAKDLGMNKKHYRKTLSALRKRINIIETNLTEKNYDAIDLEKVPSRAMFKYRTALHTRLGERMEQYIEDVSSGEKKMNTSNMLPDEIVARGMRGGEGITRDLEVMWENLDNVLELEDNALVMADVSGSMTGKPMEVSVGLAIYTAERITGEFKDYFLTFSKNPNLIHVPSSMSLQDKITKVMRSDWGMNTDLNKAFEKILDTAVKHNIPQEEMPSKLIIISDMEFDGSHGWYYGDSLSSNKERGYTKTTHENMKDVFALEGYNLPEIVYWNVDARNENIPVRHNEFGVAMVSGFSPNILKSVIGKDILNPVNMMLDTLNKKGYEFLEDIL